MSVLPALRASEQAVVRPPLDAHFPGLPHAAANVGPGSDVLGFDTELSRDHYGGPAVVLFLRAEDLGRAPAVRELMRHRLPHTFLGHPTNFGSSSHEPGMDVLEARTEGPVNHHVGRTRTRRPPRPCSGGRTRSASPTRCPLARPCSSAGRSG